MLLHSTLLSPHTLESVEFVLLSHSFRDNVLEYLEPLLLLPSRSSRFDAFTGVPASPISIPLKRNVVIRWNLILPGYSSDNREFSSNRTEYCERKHFHALLLLLLSQVGNYTVGIPVTCLIDVILSKSSK